MPLMELKKVAVFELRECPKEIFEAIASRYNFAKDTHLEYVSELTPSSNEDWGQNLSTNKIENYWKSQKEINNYTGTLDDFIIDYNLIVDKWFIDSGFDFSGVEAIFFNCW